MGAYRAYESKQLGNVDLLVKNKLFNEDSNLIFVNNLLLVNKPKVHFPRWWHSIRKRGLAHAGCTTTCSNTYRLQRMRKLGVRTFSPGYPPGHSG